MSAPWLADTAHDRVADVADLAGLVAENAGAGLLRPAGADQRDEARLGDLCAGHLDQVAHAVVERGLRAGRVDHAPLQCHMGLATGRVPHRAAELEIEFGTGVAGRAEGGRRERATPHDHDQVHRRGEPRHVCGGLFGGDAGPRRELVATESHAHDAPGPELASRRVEDLASEP